MAAAYRVLLTATALADLEGIARYIRRDSPQNAATTAGKILEAIDSLESMPGRFRRAGSSRKRRTPWRAAAWNEAAAALQPGQTPQ